MLQIIIFFFKIRSCWHNWNGFHLSNNYRRDFPTAPKNGESPTPLGAICVTRTLISFRDAVLVVNRTHNRDKRVSILESYGIPGDAHKKGDLAVRAAVRSIWHLNPCALFAQSRQYTGMEESTGHKHAVRGLSSPAGGFCSPTVFCRTQLLVGLLHFENCGGWLSTGLNLYHRKSPDKCDNKISLDQNDLKINLNQYDEEVLEE